MSEKDQLKVRPVTDPIKKYLLPTYHTNEFSPFNVLFDSVFSDVDRVFNDMSRFGIGSAPGYPPYNVRKYQDNSYSIEIAVAGFAPEELSVQVDKGIITVSGQKTEKDDSSGYIHRGLATRSFTQQFAFREGSEVVAAYEHGILRISIFEQPPPESKPKSIKIGVAG